MKNIIFLVVLLSVFMFSCQLDQKEKEELYKIETEYGDMVFKLYDATPLHKANIKNLIEQDYYDDLLFHRVIDSFMIQGGDPDSRKAVKGQSLGFGGLHYTIPAEIVDTIFHRRGVIAAAREGDKTNPEMKSNSSQFYIVQGKVFDDDDIKKVEDRINASNLNKLITKYTKEAENEAYNTGGMIDYEIIIPEARKKAEEELKNNGYYKITGKKLEAYKTVGGTPHLDNAYTVFGEIVEGLEVLDIIISVETDENDRPVKDIRMKIKKL